MAFRTEVCVSWGREAAHCCSQACFPFWLESGLLLFSISHFCPGRPGFWLWIGGCCDTAWGSLMDFSSCLGPVAMAPSCRSWQGLGLGRKEMGACARPPAGSRPWGFLRPWAHFFLLGPTLCRSFAFLKSCDRANCSFSLVGSETCRDGAGLLRHQPCHRAHVFSPPCLSLNPFPRRAVTTCQTAFFWKAASSSYC